MNTVDRTVRIPHYAETITPELRKAFEDAREKQRGFVFGTKG